MPQATAQTNFNAGELSPRMGGRVDLAAYQNGLAELTNMVPLVQGPVTKVPGTIFVDRAASDTRASRLIPFTPRQTQAYVIEATPGAFRFFTNDALLTSGGSVVTVATPWAATDLPNLQWQSSNDVLYLVDGARQQRKLTRTAADAFTLVAFDLKKGPFRTQNSDKTITVTATGTLTVGGTVTLTATSAIFKAGHVGGLFALEVLNFASIPAWEPDYVVQLGDLRRSDGKVYKVVQKPANGSERTGSVQPTHDEGREWDGMNNGIDRNNKGAGGVLWEFQYTRFGIVRITGFSSGTSVTGTVVQTLPADLATTASWRWSHGAFSDAEGWPSCIAIWNERLILAKDNEVHASVVGDFANFAPRTDGGLLAADQAWRITLPSAEPVRWLTADRTLLIGTSNGEYAVLPLDQSRAVAAGNIDARRQSSYGSAAVRAQGVGTRTLFVQRGGRKVRQMGYNFQTDRYEAADITIRSAHITRPEVQELALQLEPESLLWCRRGDGQLAVLTFIEDESVRGWSRVGVGGAVESIAVVPSPDGGADNLWLAVRRDIAGTSRRFIERLAPFRDEGDLLAEAFFVNSGLTYRGAPATILSGLSHLTGASVVALADGKVVPAMTVNSTGDVVLPYPASVVHVGLPFTARIRTLRLEAPANDGSIQTRVKRIVKLGIRVLDSLGLKVGGNNGKLDEIFRRAPSAPMGSAMATLTGDEYVPVPGGFDRDGVVTLESADPLPLTVLLLAPSSEAGQ